MDCAVCEGNGWNIGRSVCNGSDLSAMATAGVEVELVSNQMVLQTLEGRGFVAPCSIG